jgi:hypothetical protein
VAAVAQRDRIHVVIKREEVNAVEVEDTGRIRMFFVGVAR